jgi:hypothetical protein
VFLAAGLAGGPLSAAAEPAKAAAGTASAFTPLSPVRVLDTRSSGGAVGAGSTVTVDLSAKVDANATAVVLNVTGVTPTADTFVTVFPAGTTRPTASSLNVPPGDTRANQVTVALGADRKVSFYNNAGSTHLVVDLAGFYGTSAHDKFTALPPKRMLDTRQTGGPLGPGGTRVLDLTGAIPASATAVTFNLTATGATNATFVTAWPAGTARPGASSLNLPAGDTRPNLVTVAVGADRKVSLFNNAGNVHLIADVTGFYTPDYGNLFVPFSPDRVLDTRNGTGTENGSTKPLGPQSYLFLGLASKLPAGTTSVALNVTGVNATAGTYVTVWAPVGDVPNASTLNLVPGLTAPNAAVVALAGSPDIQFYNNAGLVHLIADLAGAFVVPSTPACTTDCVYDWGTRAAGLSWPPAPLPTPVAALGNGVKAVAGDGRNSYALMADGTVKAWGYNTYGELGNGWWVDWGYGGSAVPVPVVGLDDVTAIAARGETAYALREDGTVWAWGQGYWGELGNGSRGYATEPSQVTGLTNIVAISAGDNNGYAVRADGTLWAWGFNGGGHLGNGSTVEFSTTPVQVSGLTGVKAVSGGGHSNGTYALLADGTVRAWGYNFAGALGNNDPCELGQECLSRVPVQVTGLTGVVAVASGVYNGMALKADGTVWTWGDNNQGKLGNGVECDFQSDPSTCQAAAPVQVADIDDATQIGTFYGGGYVLRENGSVWAWGSGSDGTLGNDTVDAYTTVPVQVMGLSGVTQLAGAMSGGLAIVANP